MCMFSASKILDSNLLESRYSFFSDIVLKTTTKKKKRKRGREWPILKNNDNSFLECQLTCVSNLA